MKKLFVLFLVLGLASTAGATGVNLSIRVSSDPCTVAFTDETTYDLLVNDTLYIGVYQSADANDVDQFKCYMEFDSSATSPPAEFTGNSYIYSPPAVPEGGNRGIVFYGYTPTYATDVLLGNISNGVPTDFTGVGTTFAVEFKCLELYADVEVRLLDDSGSPIDSITISQVIPEPMSIALLGLGGLFLRRRKK